MLSPSRLNLPLQIFAETFALLAAARSAIFLRGPRMTVRTLPALLVLILMGVLPSVSHAQARRVAVLDFANTSKDPAIEALGPAMAETLTTKLHSLRALHLVERDRLYRLLQEQKLQQTDLVDPSRAVYVGKLLGADRVVLGTYVKRGDSVSVIARFVDTATGTIVATSQVHGTYDPKNPRGFWEALNQLAQATIDSLNTHVEIVRAQPQVVPVPQARRIEPTPQERTRLTKPPTWSLEAQEAYGRGLLSYKRGEYTNAAREFERATSMDSDYVDAWVSLGAALGNLGQSPRAVTAFERAYRLYLTLGDEPGQASTLGRIGVEYDRQTRSTDALIHYEGSLKLLMKLGDESGQAITLHNIGISYTGQGRYADALAYHDRALAFQQKLGNEPGQAATLFATGLAYEGQGHDAEALSSYGRALELQEKLGNEAGQAITVTRIGDLHGSRGRYAEALASYGRALELQEKLGNEAGQATTFYATGLAYEVQGHDAEALSSYGRALALQQKLGNEAGQATVLDNMAKVHEGQGRTADTLSVYERGLRLREKLADELGQARTLNNIGLVYARQGRYADALRSYERSLRLAEKLGEERGQAFILSNIGDLRRAQGRYADALSFYERALEIADRLGTPERESYRRLRDQMRSQSRSPS
jgi:tetratricopeptide (TPR) repeat protein